MTATVKQSGLLSCCIVSLAMALTTAGCDHVFYQPMREMVATPDRLGIPWEPLEIIVPDGAKLGAWHMKTRNKLQGLVIHAHGNAENRSTHMNFVAWMTNAGFDVLVFDYRGYGDSEGFASRAWTVEDAGAVIEWVTKWVTKWDRKLGNSGPRYAEVPIVLLGQSLGGAISTSTLGLYARQNPTARPVDGLILDSTFSSYRRIAREKLGQFWVTWPLQWPLSFLVSDHLSPISAAAAIDIPVLQFHSRRDHVVPIKLGRELFDSFKSVNKQFIEIPTPGHLVAFAIDSSEYRDKAVEFIRQLGANKKRRIQK